VDLAAGVEAMKGGSAIARGIDHAAFEAVRIATAAPHLVTAALFLNVHFAAVALTHFAGITAYKPLTSERSRRPSDRQTCLTRLWLDLA
jgi:hypothetical protein